jgi:hypothetical protein
VPTPPPMRPSGARGGAPSGKMSTLDIIDKYQGSR